MKRKTFKPKIKPFAGATLVAFASYDSRDLLEFVAGMGYLLYEDPNDTQCAIISDKVLTYGDVRKNHKKFDVDIDWWDNTTGYPTTANEELRELSY